MAQQADGTVYINTKIDTSGVETDTRKIQSAIKRTAGTVSRIGSSIKNAFSFGKISGGDSAVDQIETIGEKVERLKEQFKYLTEYKGLSFGDENVDSVYQSLTAAQQELKAYKASLTETQTETVRFSDRVKKAFSSVVGVVKKAGVAMLGLNKSTKKSNAAFGGGLKTILKYGLGIRSLYALFRKFRSALVEGFKSLAQYDGQTNASISSMQSALTRLKNSFATAFNPILTVVAPALTTFINMISQAVTYVGMLIAALTGASTFTKAVAVQEDYAASLGDTAKNAKEADKYLSGLDEIRTYSESKDSSGGGGYTAPNPQDMFETVPIEDKIKQFADKMKQIFSEMFAPLKEAWNEYGDSITETLERIKGDFADFGKQIGESTVDWFKNLNWDPLLASVDNLLKGLQPLVDVVLDGLAWAWENVLLPFGKWTIEEALPVILEDLGKAFEFVRVVLEALQPVFLWLWQNILVPFGQTVGEVAIGILEAFGGVLDFLIGVFTGDWERAFSGLQTAGEGLRDAVFAIFDFIEHILEVFDDFLQGVFSKDWTDSFGLLGNIINDFFDLVEIVWNLVKGVFEGVIQFFKGVFTGNWSQAWSGIEKILSSAWEAIKGVASVAVNFVKDIVSFGWNSIKTVTSTIWNGGIKPLLSNTWNWIKDTASNIFNGIKNNLSNTWNLVKTGASAVWSGIKKTLSNIWSGIKNTASNVFSGIQNTISNAWNTVSNIIGNLKNIFNDVKNAASNTVSNIVSFFSNIRLPSIPMPHFSVGTETVSILGKSFEIPSVSVNWYASGGLFDQPSLIGVGEAGKEAVLPLENRKTMSAIANSIVANLPKPYLASGAVVPPKAQYSTVNIETSRRQEMDDMYSMMKDVLSRLGQTVGNGEKGGTYTFIGQINRRTLFEEMMTEAQLVRDRTGRNPYEMA